MNLNTAAALSFLEEIREEIHETINNQPTKQVMTASMGVWLSHISTIKQILEE